MRVEKELLKNKIRTELDIRNETINKKIRETRLQKIPYLLIIGNEEVDNDTVTVRNRDTGNQSTVTIEKFLENIINEVNSYALTLSADR